MRQIFNWFLFLIIINSLSSCLYSSGYIYTLYSEQFPKEKKAIKKVVLINPEYKAYFNLEDNDQNYELGREMRKSFLEIVNRYSKDSGFKYEVISSDGKKDVGTEFFTELLPLRQVVLQAISNQDNPLNEIYEANYKRVASQVFVVNTFIPAEMSELEKKYGTPYFGILEVFSGQDHSYLIHIIADVSHGIITYQEIKMINGPMKKRKLTPLIFDTFNALKKI